MEEKKFNPENLNRLNNPVRLKEFPAELVLKLTGIQKPEVIIDIGAGTAFFSISFADLFVNCKIFACDISDIMINWIEINIKPKYSNIFPLKMEEIKVPLENNIADFLFMVNLHHELNNPEETISECNRLLKPGGKIAISDWRKEMSDRGPSYELKVNTEDIEKQLQNAGFNNISHYIDFPNNFLVIAEKPENAYL